jgi:hypothetical protein
MPDQYPKMGIIYEVQDKQANATLRRIMGTLMRIERQQKQLANSTVRTEKVKENAVRMSSSKMRMFLRRLRFDMVSLMFFMRILSKAVSEGFQIMSESAEAAATRGGVRALAQSYEVNVGRIARALQEMSNGALSAKDAIAVAQSGLIQDQGEFSNQYAELWEAARVAAVTSGADAQKVFESLVQSLVEGTGEAADSVTNIFQVQLAMQKYAEATGIAVSEIDHQTAAQIQLNAILGKTQELLALGADEALEEADAFRSLSANWQNFRDVLGQVARPGGALTAINKLLVTTTQLMIIMSGVMESELVQNIQVLTRLMNPLAQVWDRMKQSIEDMAPGLEKLGINLALGGDTDKIQKAMESLNLFNDEVEEGTYVYERFAKTPERNIDPIIDHILKREDLMEQHTHRVEMIELQRTHRLEDIQIRFDQTIARKERQARRSREKAHRDYSRRVAKETADHHLDILQTTEKYLQNLQHERQRFRIESLQDERLYQYERGLLVAYGDVLAIEDLDARYALEQQSRGENFAQELREDQQNFDLKLQHKREQFELELQQIKQALDDQLMEIHIRLQDQLAEAEEQRQEDIRRANRDYQQRLEEEQYNHERSLEQWRQHWAKISEQTKVGAQEITQILQEYFGL